MTGPIGDGLLTDMRRGNVLRIKRDVGGRHEYDSFDLKGFSRNIGKLKAKCKPASSYFDEQHRPATSNDHELFL